MVVLLYINVYIKIYQFNKICGKGVGLQDRKLSYSPPPVQIINNQMNMAIQHIKKVFKKKTKRNCKIRIWTEKRKRE